MDLRFHHFWQTSFFIMRLIPGWLGTFRAAHTSVMPMMELFIVQANKRPERSYLPLAKDWPMSVWSFIQTRRRSCTAKMQTAKAHTSMSSLIFWVTSFVPDWPETDPVSFSSVFRQLSAGDQQCCDQGDRAKDQRLASQPSQ